MSDFYVGRRLSYDGHRCTVRYVGQVKGTAGDWLGVEWDDPSRGKHSGRAKGVKYFDCVFPNAASFVRPSRSVDGTRTFLQSLRHKYIGGGSALRDQHTNIRISGKEVEAVGFDKIQKRQAAFGTLTRVYLDATCLNRAFDKTLGESLTDIYATCPNLTELDLGENLIETFDQVASICSQLDGLATLWLNGNRFMSLSHHLAPETFSRILNLTLESCFLTWTECVKITSHFANLSDLSLLRNNLSTTSFNGIQNLPPSITVLNLGFNDFQTLGPGLNLVARLPNLRKILLHQCNITTVAFPTPCFSSTLSAVDLSYNNIGSWSLVDQLPAIFPGMTHLLISHNPIFKASASQKDTSTTDLLITARLPNLTRLNNSAISPKYREEAEMYYISVVAREIETETGIPESVIIEKNLRYLELCALYETPVFKRIKHRVNPNSLAARLINIRFITQPPVTDQPEELSADIPKELSIYGLIGHVSRLYNSFYISPLNMILYKEEEKIETLVSDKSGANYFWNSDDEDENMGRRVIRLVPITPSPRTVGMTFDGDDVKCFINIRPNIQKYDI